ncbi:MAG: M42 family metallopeptidase [Streptococcaceae bacterium]|jgi:putative aminopeptidase FrvX|nr:M42 family metallopeptidase [Streptococcaceae bacterium]
MVNDEEIFFKRLTEAKAVPGNEQEVRDLFREIVTPVADEIINDGLGGIAAKHRGDADNPVILFASHMDEVGFMVTNITEKGFIKFQTLGGWWGQVILAQQVTITTRDGKSIHGVVGSKPPHVLTAKTRKKPVDIKDMFIDIGASSKKEVEDWGIVPGDMITPYINYQRLNGSKYLLAKAWDNRIGIAVTLKVLENLANSGHPNTIFAGANVQEEVGLRGARTLTHLTNPDIAFALDTGIAGDTPEMTPKEADSALGKGAQIVFFDASMVAHTGLRNFVVDVAKKLSIPYQPCFMPGGGTDAGQMHLSHNGVPSLAITVPVRYLHSHTSIVHEDDYHNMIKLVTEIIQRLDAQTVAKLKQG